MAGIFESHDRSKFEVTALSFSLNDNSKMRQRLIKAFDDFVDISGKNDDEAARIIREKEIDIVVDLKGYTHNARPGILARRAAPIQVNYLGYPGTMGAPYIDYIIADEVLIPPEAQHAYAEKVAYLPDTYQPNDRKRVIADTAPSRAGLGLPASGFVFCCFNNCFKITPDIFDIWMRLLKAAKERGIAPERIIFAAYAKPEDHLARHRHADLFLDTLPYNAHTTASDALWAGLPLITCMGDTFAGRVAGSLLKAAGMPELVTTSLQEYEKLALGLAREPAKLKALKDKLVKNHDTCALFDTAGYTRDLESAYLQMCELHKGLKAPQSFHVKRRD